MTASAEESPVVIELFADASAVAEAVAVMHYAFEQYTAKGQPSGALRETAETMRAEMAGGLRLGVARIDGRVVAMVKHKLAADGTLYFGRLGVDPDVRGRGLAGQIVRALRAQAEAEGLAGLSCAVRADEVGNIALYERLGMEIVERESRTSLTGAVLEVVVMKDRVPGSHADAPALIVIDVQKGFDDEAFWGPRDNPHCEQNIAALIAHWRAQTWPIVFVRHDSQNPASPLHPDNAGHAFKEVITGDPDLLVSKSVNSSFYGTPDLHAWLQTSGIGHVVICGITTNHCCETTARMAGNLGYDVDFVIDATHTFDRVGPDGKQHRAASISAMTAVNLHGEFATVVRTADLVDAR